MIFNNFEEIIGKIILFHFVVPKYLNYITLGFHRHAHVFRPFVSEAEIRKMIQLFLIHALENPDESIVRGFQNLIKAFHRLPLPCRSRSRIPVIESSSRSRPGGTHFQTSIISLSAWLLPGITRERGKAFPRLCLELHSLNYEQKQYSQWVGHSVLWT